MKFNVKTKKNKQSNMTTQAGGDSISATYHVNSCIVAFVFHSQ